MELKVSLSETPPAAWGTKKRAQLIGWQRYAYGLDVGGCRAEGRGDTEQEAHAALLSESRELHAALGPWLAEQDDQAAARGDRDEDMAHQVCAGRGVSSPRVAILALVRERLDNAIAEGTGGTHEEALASLRGAIEKLHASHWAAFARALKGGE